MSIKEDKKKIRDIVKEKKKEYSLEKKIEISKKIMSSLSTKDYFQKSKTIAFYWSMPDEVFTHDFILSWYKEKRILLPCVENDILLLREFKGMETMRKGEAFSILEPIGEVFNDFENIDLILVPGIGFDKNGNRVGRGKGYYDKLLHNSKAIKVGVCFPFQVFDSIPMEEFDIKMDFIIYN